MSVTDIPHSPPTAPAAGPEPQRCDECGTAVENDQRYCVNCGAHRRTANDPAARYFSQVTARSRAKTVVARGAQPRRSSPLVLGLALAVIPVAVGVGVAVGRSSNNDDGKLIQALNHRQAAATTVAAAPSTTVTRSSASSAPATSSHTGKHAAGKGKAAKGTHAKKAHHKAGASAGQTAAQKAGISAPATKTKVGGSGSAAQQAQGKKIVNKLKHTTGTGYLDQLPQQVVVP